MTGLGELWNRLINMFNSVEFSPINDTLDILLVTVIIYFVFKFLRDRRAGKLASGVVLFLVLLMISDMFEMRALNFLLQSVTQAGLVALLIVFQPELRSALEKMGSGPIKNIKAMFLSTDLKEYTNSINEICDAVERLSLTKTGALLVFERETKLGDVVNKKTIIDASINSSLIGNIFYNKAPLHDGAVIIRDNRIYAASCFLPLTQNQDVYKELGTRHRAAIGITEVCDAVVVVVSEETGLISFVNDGVLQRGLSVNDIRERLTQSLIMDNKIFKKAKEEKEAKREKKTKKAKEEKDERGEE